MYKAAWLLAIVAAVGCKGDDGGSVNGRTISDVDLPDRDPDISQTGDLSTGTTIDLGWADDAEIACFPGNENVNFNGNNVFFTEEKSNKGFVYIVVDPEAGVDTSFYVLEYTGAPDETPPDVTHPARCDAGYDQSGDHNPGSPDAVELDGFPERTMEIGVAGANGATSGAFTLSIWLEETNLDSGI
jgi:hypothetical protein